MWRHLDARRGEWLFLVWIQCLFALLLLIGRSVLLFDWKNIVFLEWKVFLLCLPYIVPMGFQDWNSHRYKQIHLVLLVLVNIIIMYISVAYGMTFQYMYKTCIIKLGQLLCPSPQAFNVFLCWEHSKSYLLANLKYKLLLLTFFYTR